MLQKVLPLSLLSLRRLRPAKRPVGYDPARYYMRGAGPACALAAMQTAEKAPKAVR